MKQIKDKAIPPDSLRNYFLLKTELSSSWLCGPKNANEIFVKSWRNMSTWQYDGGGGQYWEYSPMESSAERGLSEGEAECRRKGEALKANYICPWNTENSGSQWNENRNSFYFFKNQTLPCDRSNALPVPLIHFPLSRFLWLLTVLMKAREKDSSN